MRVEELTAVCEYTNFIILDAYGNELPDTLENYKLDVEFVNAKNSIVMIHTYDKWDDYIMSQFTDEEKDILFKTY